MNIRPKGWAHKKATNQPPDGMNATSCILHLQALAKLRVNCMQLVLKFKINF